MYTYIAFHTLNEDKDLRVLLYEDHQKTIFVGFTIETRVFILNSKNQIRQLYSILIFVLILPFTKGRVYQLLVIGTVIYKK